MYQDFADEVCAAWKVSSLAQEYSRAWVPHEVWSVRRVSHLINHQKKNGQADKMMKGRQFMPTVGGRVKCRMKCFYETRSHGPQDQDFDVILI